METNLISKLQSLISKPNVDEKAILYQLKRILLEWDLQNESPREAKSLMDLYGESIKSFDSKEDYYKLIRTGWANFDKPFGGFGAGEFIVIGGRPSLGKTQLLVNLALYISVSHPLLYFSYDLSNFILASRFMSCLSGIGADKILQQKLFAEDDEILRSLEKDMPRFKITISESYKNSISSFKNYCIEQIEKNGYKVIMIDFLQMMGSSKHYNTRELEISHISRELKNIANDYNVCIVATSQLSRAVELRSGSKRPQLSDLRESGAIEQNADKVIFIHRPEIYGIMVDEDGNSTAGLVELIVAKNRNGRLGEVKLLRDTDFTSLKDFDEYKTDFNFSANRLNEMERPF